MATLNLALGVTLACLLAATAVVAILKRPSQAVLVFLAASPFNYFYVIAFGWQVSWAALGTTSAGAPAVIKFAKDAVFLGLLLVCSLALINRQMRWRYPIRILDLLVGAFVGYQIIMVVPATLQLGLLPSLIALWQNCGYALAYFVLRHVFTSTDPARIRVWVSNVLLIAGLVAIIGIWQALFGPTVFRYESGDYRGLNRAISTLGSPNNLGMYLSIVLTTCIATRSYKQSVAHLIATGLLVVCLVLTVSMTALIATLTGIALVVASSKNWKQLLTLAGAMLLVGLVITIMMPGIAHRVVAALTGRDQAWILRLSNWAQIWNARFPDSIVGTGPGTGGVMTISFFDRGGLADNQYLAVLVQYGFCGLFMYLGILLSGIALGSRRFAATSRPAEKGLLLAAGIVVGLVGIFGITANVLNVFPINLYFWCALALVASMQSAVPVSSKAWS